jgi:formylglycine-generating enzyme required for sulfatase activity/predicted Ser/Thr protein kinase
LTQPGYEQIKSHFIAASALRGAERSAYLERLGHEDEAVRRELERLLAADESDEGILATLDVGAADRSWSVPTRRPERIGAYTITGTLGVGGMGVVYRAEQEHPHRAVALKVLRPDVISRQSMRRFEHEAQVLARLQHPGIGHVYEAGRHDAGLGAQPFFVMELVEGPPLTEFASSRGLDTHERLELFIKVCRAVEHAHGKGVIHRDLKPANILVSAEGEPKVLDFGVARLTDSDVRTTTLRTDVGQVIGTVAYMSPEQVSGDTEALDRRSDVYALGVVLYELLAGSLPLDLRQRSIPEAARMIQEDDPVPLSSIDRHLRGDLDTIAAKALEKSAERRYPSAAALADDIERHLRYEPVLARPPGFVDGLRKFGRRHPAAAAGLAGAFTVVLATAIVFLSMYGATRQALHEKRAALDDTHEANRRAASTARDLWESTSATEPETWLDPDAQATAAAARNAAARGAVAFDAERFDVAAESFVDALSGWHEAERLQQSTVERIIATVRTAVAERRLHSAEAALGRLRALRIDDDVVRPLAADVSLLRLHMVEVPAGSFEMGGRGRPADQPFHTVRFARGFLVSATEITQGQFLAVTGRNPSIYGDRLEHPVENVSWYDAADFCNRLSERMGLAPYYRLGDLSLQNGTISDASVARLGGTGFRLPTEAEWEYACRAGTETRFSYGESPTGGDDHMWHRFNADRTAHAVATKRPNAWGLYDMHGNVWEWCEDRWHPTYDGAPDDGSAWLAGGTNERLLRGGCFDDPPEYCRAGYRRSRGPGNLLQYRGFRVVRSLD